MTETDEAKATGMAQVKERAKAHEEAERLRKKSTSVPAGSGNEVRPAGAEQAGVDPKKWDEVDEESDESFPASDPPSNY